MARTKFNAGQIQTGSAGGIKGDSNKHLVLDFKDQLANEGSVASTMLIPLQGASSGDVKRASVADIIAAGISIAGSVEGAIQLRSSDGTQLAADDEFKIASNTMTVGSGNSLDVVGTLKLGGVAVSSTAAELNILDGVTATAAELNILDGVTSTAAELNILDGVTSTAAELNLVDGISAGAVVASKAAMHNSAGSLLVTDNAYIGAVGDVDMLQFDGGEEITVASDLDFIIGKAGGLQLADGAVTSTAAELNLIDGSSAGTIVNSKAVVYGSSGEVNATTLQIAGTSITATAAELNIMDGVTSTTAELNILDGVTATASEINVLDGASAANSSAGLAAIVGTSGDLAVARNLSVTGNLTINGTTTTVNSTTVTVDDPIMTLGGDTAPESDDNKDRGIEFRYYDGSAKVGFMGWDDSAGGFALFKDATNTSEVFSGTAADLAMGGLSASSLTLGGVAVSSTAAELNILDGVTATTAELNILDGVTSTAAELNILDGVTSTTAELNILDGVTSTAAELNLVDGISAGAVVASKAAMHTSDGSLLVTDAKYMGAVGDADMLQFTGGSSITVASDLDLIVSDGKLKLGSTAVSATAAELNLIDGSSAGTIVNSKAVVYGSSGEVNATTLQIAGTSITATAAELNIMDGVTATAAELNILDGVTATAAELNILDGVTSTAAELNILDGATVTVTELNIMDGNTSATATTLVDADRLVCNDAGTMKQVAMTDISDYMSGRVVQDHFMASADGGAAAIGGSTPTASFEVGSSGNPALNSVTLAASTYAALSATPQSIEELQVYLNGQLLVGYHQGSDAAYDYAYSTSIDGSNPGIALKPESGAIGSSGAAIDSDDVLVIKYIKA